jgi:NADH dehydrogenase
MAPGLKTVEDALEMRQRIFLAFEAAERETDPQRQQAWMTFVVVGAGPTGVELAGALGELTRSTLRGDFHNIDPTKARIVLLEGLDRVLPPYPPELSHEARNQLIDRGVTVRTGTLVTDIKGDLLTLKSGDQQEQLYAHTVLWSAGVRASALGKVLERRIGAELDRAGRVKVAPDLSVPEHPNVFVIGDLAYYDHQDDKPLPGVATVAIQQGQFIAKLIDARLHGKPLPGFRYRDKGSLAVIGRNAAVADLGPLHFGGYIAWLIWVFVHIASLVEFDKRLIVMFQWSWSYLTRKRGARLITNVDPVVLLENREPVRTR